MPKVGVLATCDRLVISVLGSLSHDVFAGVPAGQNASRLHVSRPPACETSALLRAAA